MLPLAALCVTLAGHAAALTAGAARVDITPPLELKASLGGYGARMSRPATGIHDRVFAKCLVLREGTTRLAIVTVDILGLPPGLKEAVLAKLSDDGWAPDQLLMLASHSHTSIDMTAINPKNVFGVPQLGIFSRPLYERTVDLLARVVRDAAGTQTPCAVGTAAIRLEGWTHNRREGNSFTAPDLTVTRIDGLDHAPIAVLVNWATHPTFMDEEDMMYSGGWPGHMQRTVEALVGGGVTAMFYNGAEGDQAPTARPDSGDSHWEKAERYGRELGIQVWRLWQRIRPRADASLQVHLEPLALPARTWHPDFLQTGGAEYGLTETSVRTLIDAMVPVASHSLSVRLGDLAIVGVPGELAAELGAEVREQVRRATGLSHVTIGGLADEWDSYILSADQYRRGGYEASMSFYGAGLGEAIVRGVERGAGALGR